MATDKEHHRVIIGAFFGAIYSIVLVQPLILMTNNDNNNLIPGNDLIQILFYPITIVIGYAIINRSLSWKHPRSVAGSRLKGFLNYTFTIEDVLLLIALIIIAGSMWYFKILNRTNALMWIIGVGTLAVLQVISIPKLVDENS